MSVENALPCQASERFGNLGTALVVPGLLSDWQIWSHTAGRFVVDVQENALKASMHSWALSA
jgi:hypothetical protein